MNLRVFDTSKIKSDLNVALDYLFPLMNYFLIIYF